MKKLLVLAAAAAALAGGFAPAQAGSVAGFGGSTEITQLANNLEMVNQSIMQMRMVEMQLKNLVNLDGMFNWNSAQPLLMNVMRTVQGAQSVAWTGQMADQQFKRLYDTTTTMMNGGTPRQTYVNYGQRYQGWADQTRSSTSAALQAAGMQIENFQSEAMALQQFKALSGNPQGQLQAIQAGTSIAAMTVEQLQQLRALQASQIQMQAAFYAEQSSKAEQERSRRQGDVDRFWE